LKLFSNDLTGRFVERPNRFLVIIDTPRGRVHAHCPNPGRLQEILLPGTPVILEHALKGSRKTEWTLAAAEYKGQIIPLISVRANRIALELVLPGLFPEAEHFRAEYSFEHSRFDFCVETAGRKKSLVEVKSCTLASHGRAMFPDAPTERGKRHVEHLAEIVRKRKGDPAAGEIIRLAADQGSPETFDGHVLFILYHPDVKVFTPHIHTDPGFSLSLEQASRLIRVRAVSISCKTSGECSVAGENIPVDFTPLEHVRQDRGVYLVLLELRRESFIETGGLGLIRFRAGSYLYAGSAKRNLSHRLSRHMRRGKKKLHWHIDYLREAADRVRAFPIYTSEDLECRLAADIRALGGVPVPGFGSSDCGCPSHLYYFRDPPVSTREFQDVLLEYRHSRI